MARYKLRDVSNSWSDENGKEQLHRTLMYRAIATRTPTRRGKFYVVFLPLNVAGIYHPWTACEQIVRGLSGAVFRGYASREDANAAFNLLVLPEAQRRGFRGPHLIPKGPATDLRAPSSVTDHTRPTSRRPAPISGDLVTSAARKTRTARRPPTTSDRTTREWTGSGTWEGITF